MMKANMATRVKANNNIFKTIPDEKAKRLRADYNALGSLVNKSFRKAISLGLEYTNEWVRMWIKDNLNAFGENELPEWSVMFKELRANGDFCFKIVFIDHPEIDLIYAGNINDSAPSLMQRKKKPNM